ncbi:hypothetical protein [Afifella sp. YEN Y35]|uniref:hypothetical protein n=1 Tax=Afifella sp. YEN Y35 TaxID=3388337 RepID=UPI0039E14FD9
MSALIVASALIGACSREPVVEDNAQPFSVVGVQLGMAKDAAIEAIGFSFCDNEAPDRAKCFFEDSERDLRFFGRHIDLATAELRDPYTTITRISFSYDGDRPNPYAIEDDWGLDGRCLNEWDLDRIVDKSGSSDLAAVARQLREWGAAPTTGDFVCVSTEGEFVEISDFGVDQGNVEMRSRSNLMMCLDQALDGFSVERAQQLLDIPVERVHALRRGKLQQFSFFELTNLAKRPGIFLLRIDGEAAAIQHQPETGLYRGVFVALAGRPEFYAPDFYAIERGDLGHAGRLSLKGDPGASAGKELSGPCSPASRAPATSGNSFTKDVRRTLCFARSGGHARRSRASDFACSLRRELRISAPALVSSICTT